MSQRDILFKVFAGGREYLIYTNGDVEGFGEGAVISNYHGSLVDRAVALALGAERNLAGPAVSDQKVY